MRGSNKSLLLNLFQICKLYLYNNEHSLAFSFHNSHVRKFGDFSRVWGIGEETFEFWSWIARQYENLSLRSIPSDSSLQETVFWPNFWSRELGQH